MAIFTETTGFVYAEEIETKTLIYETEDGKEKTRNDWPTGTINAVTQGYAKRTFRLVFNAVNQTRYNAITQFVLQRAGRKESFYWENPNESPVSRLYPDNIILDDDYQADDTTQIPHYPLIGDSQTIYDDGDALEEGVDYSLDDDTGIITWIIKPANGSVITADYRFYREVRFLEDNPRVDRIAFNRYNIELRVREIEPRL